GTASGTSGSRDTAPASFRWCRASSTSWSATPTFARSPSMDRPSRSRTISRNAPPTPGELKRSSGPTGSSSGRGMSSWTFASPYANGDAVLLMVGDDHVEAYARLPEAVREMRQAFPNVDVRIASLEDFASAMPALQHRVSGEIASGRYRPILRGVNSTRVWIKQ